MIGTLLLAVGLLALAVILFVVSVRVGILVGRRLDRAIEARLSEDSMPVPPAGIDQEENRGE
jgi:hypothetical protein